MRYDAATDKYVECTWEPVLEGIGSSLKALAPLWPRDPEARRAVLYDTSRRARSLAWVRGDARDPSVIDTPAATIPNISCTAGKRPSQFYIGVVVHTGYPIP